MNGPNKGDLSRLVAASVEARRIARIRRLGAAFEAERQEGIEGIRRNDCASISPFADAVRRDR